MMFPYHFDRKKTTIFTQNATHVSSTKETSSTIKMFLIKVKRLPVSVLDMFSVLSKKIVFIFTSCT